MFEQIVVHGCSFTGSISMMLSIPRIRRVLHRSTLHTLNSRSRWTTWYFLAFHLEHSVANSEKDHSTAIVPHKRGHFLTRQKR